MLFHSSYFVDSDLYLEWVPENRYGYFTRDVYQHKGNVNSGRGSGVRRKAKFRSVISEKNLGRNLIFLTILFSRRYTHTSYGDKQHMHQYFNLDFFYTTVIEIMNNK